MAVNPLQQAIALLLVFAVPGFLLLKAAFPRRAFGAPTTAFLSLVLSTAVTVLLGSALGFLPSDGAGFFQGAATGGPILELTLAGASTVLFGIALARGAFPRLVNRSAPAQEATDTGSDRLAEAVRLRAEEARAGSAEEAERARENLGTLEAEVTRERYG